MDFFRNLCKPIRSTSQENASSPNEPLLSGRPIEYDQPIKVLPDLYLGSEREGSYEGFTNMVSIGAPPYYILSARAARNTTLCQLEVRDSKTESIGDIVELAVAEIDEARATEGAKVLVYSHQNLSQATAVLAAYLMREEKMSLRGALALIKKAGQKAQPGDGFMRQLKQMESRIKAYNREKRWNAIRSLWAWPSKPSFE
ncbi:hypothetical protein O1611_g5537 [Lasiodiplodia mahajangana]|uniref:Uncharacterized protein n=1 Tax=Lasiodiplodia mahajangana TaxID=1108764 RepID=A0ACC2JKS0_9PEZI|nr:hypothetical protein O1611_g5537 [Lasiodiplodia mahajangana]